MSSEFPFLLASFLFPKYSKDIINLMIVESDDPVKRDRLKILKKIIELLKSIFKSYSELKFRKAILIPEIRFLIQKFLREAKRGEIEINGLIKEDPENDKLYIQKITQAFDESITSILRMSKN